MLQQTATSHAQLIRGSPNSSGESVEMNKRFSQQGNLHCKQNKIRYDFSTTDIAEFNQLCHFTTVCQCCFMEAVNTDTRICRKFLSDIEARISFSVQRSNFYLLPILQPFY
jgi:hypothetical protein